jgi:prepilin-type N-terminal cleavage/methylation domain-containing protein
MASTNAGRQGFTLIELLVVIAIISVIASLVVPIVSMAREKANILHCANNLKQIYPFAVGYSEKDSVGFFPLGSGKAPRAHESLNELIASEPEALTADLFVCRSSEAKEAQPDGNGNLVLEDENLSYAWLSRRLKITAVNKIIACDKYVDGYEDEAGSHIGHAGVNALMSDGSVRFLKPAKLSPDTLLPEGLTR